MDTGLPVVGCPSSRSRPGHSPPAYASTRATPSARVASWSVSKSDKRHYEKSNRCCHHSCPQLRARAIRAKRHGFSERGGLRTEKPSRSTPQFTASPLRSAERCWPPGVLLFIYWFPKDPCLIHKRHSGNLHRPPCVPGPFVRVSLRSMVQKHKHC